MSIVMLLLFLWTDGLCFVCCVLFHVGNSGIPWNPNILENMESLDDNANRLRTEVPFPEDKPIVAKTDRSLQLLPRLKVCATLLQCHL